MTIAQTSVADLSRETSKGKTRDRHDSFAAMPPLEAKKILFRKAGRLGKTMTGETPQKMKIMMIGMMGITGMART